MRAPSGRWTSTRREPDRRDRPARQRRACATRWVLAAPRGGSRAGRAALAPPATPGHGPTPGSARRLAATRVRRADGRRPGCRRAARSAVQPAVAELRGSEDQQRGTAARPSHGATSSRLASGTGADPDDADHRRVQRPRGQPDDRRDDRRHAERRPASRPPGRALRPPSPAAPSGRRSGSRAGATSDSRPNSSSTIGVVAAWAANDTPRISAIQRRGRRRLGAGQARGQRRAPRDDPRGREDGQPEARVVAHAGSTSSSTADGPAERRRGRAGPTELAGEQRHARHRAGAHHGRGRPDEHHVDDDRERGEDGPPPPLHARPPTRRASTRRSRCSSREIATTWLAPAVVKARRDPDRRDPAARSARRRRARPRVRGSTGRCPRPRPAEALQGAARSSPPRGRSSSAARPERADRTDPREVLAVVVLRRRADPARAARPGRSARPAGYQGRVRQRGPAGQAWLEEHRRGPRAGPAARRPSAPMPTHGPLAARDRGRADGGLAGSRRERTPIATMPIARTASRRLAGASRRRRGAASRQQQEDRTEEDRDRLRGRVRSRGAGRRADGEPCRSRHASRS